MNQWFGLNEYLGVESYLQLTFLIAFVAVIAGVFGYFSDYLMKEHGFGVIGNGILILAGSAVGLYARANYGQYDDITGINLTVFYVVGVSTFMLFIFGVIKSWLVH
ncbi:MAG: hypothetical protein KGQ37_10715 [Hyphomicrobiales bacterium]|nr:hypothetical protein [Hyphomicrobiales bacterium]